MLYIYRDESKRSGWKIGSNKHLILCETEIL